ncbi:hypothetical protein DYB37_010720 [Aphanomyces astaci]|uniref:Calcineurin-like phosphoesterase domain-containing protein n=1 Tax=Aphanomyces astaci TaxID=112090 RepID=A0A3R7EI69_APHAT|nr:hypothetical protein DYB35_012312 [Aphanomyces astaci]RHZ11570.1 hypothetical protein DYB37_010720 [Aphanomyces astaci]
MLPAPEEISSRPRRRAGRIVLGVAALALIGGGAAAAVVLTQSKGTTTPTSEGSSSQNKPPSSLIGGAAATTLLPSGGGNLRPSTTPVIKGPPKSNPEIDPVLVTMLAIGDWGSTNVDFRSQQHVANLLAQSALELKPKAILGHGDNIYWNGVGKDDVKARMDETFDKVYSDVALLNVPWYNVAGNHDVGGSVYLCGDRDGAFRECKSVAEMLDALDSKFNLQRDYKSSHNNRWIMEGHYYVKTVKQQGVTIDIFNLDTNEASAHGATQVCCQCFSYRGNDKSVKCNEIDKGSPFCAGGNMDMYNACMNRIQSWATESYDGVMRDLALSKADFKIINTHYSPHYHMSRPLAEKWFNVTKPPPPTAAAAVKGGVHAWFNGHTHGFNHDVTTWNTHFFQNGAGGGIVSQSGAQADPNAAKVHPEIDTYALYSVWVAAGQPYGFMEVSASKEWLKVQFVSFDKAWVFGGHKVADTVAGGLARGHCWYIHKSLDGPGVPCASSNDGVVGMPT